MGHQRAAHTEEPDTSRPGKAAHVSLARHAARPAVDPMLRLQRHLGNWAVTQLMQAKLQVGGPGDGFEQEADRVAEAVTRAPTPAGPPPATDEGHGVQPRPRAAPVSPPGLPHPAAEAGAVPAPGGTGRTPEVPPALEARLHAASGGGEPLADANRTFFDWRFGYDFSRVRVHRDALAGRAAGALQARAFTRGQDVFFGAGHYQPHTTLGRQLLAHELTHVVQQTGGRQDRPGARRREASGMSTLGQVRSSSQSGVIQRAAEDVPRMDAALQACLAAIPFDRMRAAEILNGFNREDLLARLAPLSSEQIAAIHQGALEHPMLGPASQVAILTQATHAEVSATETGGGGGGQHPLCHGRSWDVWSFGPPCGAASSSRL